MVMHEVRFDIDEIVFLEAMGYSRELGIELEVMLGNAFAGYMEAVRIGRYDDADSLDEWTEIISGFEAHMHPETRIPPEEPA